MHNNITKTRRVTMLFVGLISALLAAELAAALIYKFGVEEHRDYILGSPDYYYQESADPILAFELAKGFHLSRGGRVITINDRGLRQPAQLDHTKTCLAILGDSVAAGLGLSQDEIPAARLKELVGTDAEVANLTTPGYGLRQLRRLLELHVEHFRPRVVFYVCNYNDFVLRDTCYEGGSNGLYRIYNAPALKLPFLIRKAVYRLQKGGGPSSVHWYRWLFQGTSKTLFNDIKEMANCVSRNGGELVVIPFPPQVAFGDNGYELQDIEDQFAIFLASNNIRCLTITDDFGRDPQRLQDQTDHLTYEGSIALARAMHAYYVGELK